MITMVVLVLVGLILAVMGLQLRYCVVEFVLLCDQIEQLRLDARAYEATIEVRNSKIEQLEKQLKGEVR